MRRRACRPPCTVTCPQATVLPTCCANVCDSQLELGVDQRHGSVVEQLLVGCHGKATVDPFVLHHILAVILADTLSQLRDLVGRASEPPIQGALLTLCDLGTRFAGASGPARLR
ncbi:MAG: hypothetical protein ACI9MC_002026 [Kiritimatiellia bacterium]|jgi:hypothetical protein